MSLIKFTLTICIYLALLPAAILNVPGNYSSIQIAIDNSSAQDTILVMPGVYTENINMGGNDLTLTSNYIFSNDVNDIQSTIIDGGEAGSCIYVADSESTINGLILTNGMNSPGHGGGIFVNFASPVISNMIIMNCVGNMGGGICCHHSSPTIENCYIFNNRGDYVGGGIASTFEGTPIIRNTVIANNNSDLGAGFYCDSGHSQLDNVLITDNIGTRGAGATIFLSDDVRFNNCTIVNNVSNFAGGGIEVGQNSNIEIINSILWDNLPEQINYTPTGADSYTTISYSNIEGGYSSVMVNGNGELTWEEGNISLDPALFHSEDGNYFISNDSPSIDSGNPAEIYNDNCIPPSMGTNRNDQGAWGGPGACDWHESIAYGCTDPEAINFNPLALFDDQSCAYMETPFNLTAEDGESRITLNWSHDFIPNREDVSIWISNVTTEYIEISMFNNSDVYGVQFYILPDEEFNADWGSAYGGSGGEYGFNMQVNHMGMILGYQLGGTSFIPAETMGVLTYVEWDQTEGVSGWIDLEIVAIAGQAGLELDAVTLEPYFYDPNEITNPHTYNVYRDGVLAAIGITDFFYEDYILPSPETFCYTVTASEGPLESLHSNTACANTYSNCQDPEACNYNPDATEDGFCDYLTCYGCLDENAINFDPQASVDNGSCQYLNEPIDPLAFSQGNDIVIEWDHEPLEESRAELDMSISVVTDESISIMFTNNVPFQGFQFRIVADESFNAVWGQSLAGFPQENGWMVSCGTSGICLGWSLSGIPIEPTTDLLMQLSWTHEENASGFIELTETIGSGENSQNISSDGGPPYYFDPAQETITFNIYRNGVMYSEGLEEMQFDDAGLVNNEYHCYEITAYNGEFESEPSEMICAEIDLNFETTSCVIVHPMIMDLISFNVVPENSSIEDIFSDNVLLLYDDQGQFYVPGYGIDLIESIDIWEGLAGFNNGIEDEEFCITGEIADLSECISLDPYYRHILPCLPQTPIDVETVFEPYSESGIIVSNDQGQFYIPEYGVNTIGAMQPGEAYRVSHSEEYPIQFCWPIPALSKEHVSETTSRPVPVHFIPVPTGISYPIILTEIRGDVNEGDEIGAYANGQLLGSGVINSNDESVIITAWQSISDYGLDLPGFNTGDVIELEYWDATADAEYHMQIELNHPYYGQEFYSSGSAGIEYEQFIPTEFQFNTAYPNPFNPVTTIDYSISSDNWVEIHVYDIRGRLVENLINNHHERGNYTIRWDGGNSSSGVYIISMVVEDQVFIQKVLLMK